MKHTTTLFLLFLMLIPSAHAWGVAYVQDHFTLEPGQSEDVVFNLQNYVGIKSKRITIELEGDTTIATLVDTQEYYLLPPKTKDHNVVVRLAIPDPAQKQYEVKVNFIALPTGGMIGLANAKTITLSIAVPAGTFEATSAEGIPLDLGEVYAVADETAEEGAQEAPRKETDIAVFDTGPSKVIMLGGMISFLTLLTLYIISLIGKRRKRAHLGF